MIRTSQTTERLIRIFQSAEAGARFELGCEKDANNLRQKLYHFKKSILRKGKYQTLKSIAERIVVKVEGNMIYVKTTANYMDALDGQL